MSSDTEATAPSEGIPPVRRAGRRRRGRPRRNNNQRISENAGIDNLPPETWQCLDDVNLIEELGYSVPTIQEMPFFLRAGIREAYTLALTRIRDTRQASANERVQAWKLFVLTSRMLLYKPSTKGKEGKRKVA